MGNFIVVDTPVERAVFQQNVKQKANIKVSGSSKGEATHIEVFA